MRLAMAFSIIAYNDTPQKRLPFAKMKRVVERVLKGEKVRNAQVSIVMVSDASIHAMNRQYLQHDYPTDIITFPLEEESIDGELYISVETAQRQAVEYGVSLTNELLRLAAHGTLHLVGYDDTSDEQRAAMKILEDRYIA
jgi:rRNA maturation RNase YbeY